ncbi:MAG: hypothetical protein V5A38_07645 [Halolamina sp.]|uniref:hypothetical protein n=1 Tax=Halolamina sp. TaxID=1940283 RepID=UPI002FC3152B
MSNGETETSTSTTATKNRLRTRLGIADEPERGRFAVHIPALGSPDAAHGVLVPGVATNLRICHRPEQQ